VLHDKVLFFNQFPKREYHEGTLSIGLMVLITDLLLLKYA